jgi:hypothetical protein
MLPQRQEIASVVVCEDDSMTLDLLCDHLSADRFGVLPAPKSCHNAANPEPGDMVINRAAVIYERFWYDWANKVEIRAKPECNKWGPLKPALVHCFADTWVAYNNKVNVVGRFRFKPGWYGAGLAPHSQGAWN